MIKILPVEYLFQWKQGLNTKSVTALSIVNIQQNFKDKEGDLVFSSPFMIQITSDNKEVNESLLGLTEYHVMLFELEDDAKNYISNLLALMAVPCKLCFSLPEKSDPDHTPVQNAA